MMYVVISCITSKRTVSECIARRKTEWKITRLIQKKEREGHITWDRNNNIIGRNQILFKNQLKQ